MLIAVVASSAIAGFYFTVVVARRYVVALGCENAPPPEPSLLTNLGSIVCIAVTTITSAVLIDALNVTTIGDAVLFG